MKETNYQFLKQLVETPSPTGSEVPVANLLKGELEPYAQSIEVDTMGSLHASFTNKSPLKIMMCAHMDEVGLMVRYISKEGFLSFDSIGGVDPAILPGLRVDVHTKTKTLRGVIGKKPIHLLSADERKTLMPMDELVIDLGLSGKKAAELVEVGDSVTYGTGFETYGQNMAVSKSFDDKAGVFILSEVFKKLATQKRFEHTFSMVATTQEEIGTRGAITSAYSEKPTVAVAFDVTHATDYSGISQAKYGKIECGAGPVIAKGPNINPIVFDLLVKAARFEHIPYQIEAEPSITGTDARSVQISRSGIPTGLVSLPLRYMHTPSEVVSLADVNACIKLLYRFSLLVDASEDFIPR